jgi:hypothetical protein
MKSEEYRINHLAELPKDFALYGTAFALLIILALCAMTLLKVAYESAIHFLIH